MTTTFEMFEFRQFSSGTLETLRGIVEDPAMGRHLRRLELGSMCGAPKRPVDVSVVHTNCNGYVSDLDGSVYRIYRYAYHESWRGSIFASVWAHSIRDFDREVKKFTVCADGVMLRNYEQVAIGVYSQRDDSDQSIVATPGVIAIDIDRWALPGEFWWKTKTATKRVVEKVYQNLFKCCWTDIDRDRTMFQHQREDSLKLVISQQLLQVLYSERLHSHKGLGTDLHIRLLQSTASRKFDQILSQGVIKSTILYFLSVVSNFGIDAASEPSLIPVTADELAVPSRVKDIYISPVDNCYVETSEFHLDPVFEFNDNIELIRGQGVTFDNGRLKFDVSYHDPTPVFIYGPVLLSGSVRYTKKSTSNSETALVRITNSRDGEQRFRKKQDLFLMFLHDYDIGPSNFTRLAARELRAFAVGGWSSINHTTFLPEMQRLSNVEYAALDSVKAIFGDFVAALHLPFPDPLEEMEHVNYGIRILNTPQTELSRDFAEEPHLKKFERVLAVTTMESNVALFDGKLKKVEAKVKYETAKHEKIPRQYITLGSEAAMCFPDIPRFMKHAMTKSCEVSNNRASLQFIAEVSMKHMDHWAHETLEMHNRRVGGKRFIGFYHSDDTHFTCKLRIGGEDCTVSCGIDIKKCDLSHGPGIFVTSMALIEEILGLPVPNYLMLFKQLMSNILLKHPDPARSDFALFRCKHIMLFSGSVLTTFINNVASVLILCSLVEGFVNNVEWTSVEAVKSEIIGCAARIGYDVSIDSFTSTRYNQACHRLPNEVFLKHFPVRTSSGDIAVKCLAPLLRNIGASEERFTSEQVRSILQGMTGSYVPDVLLPTFEMWGIQIPPDLVISSEALAERYGVPVTRLQYSLTEFLTLRGPHIVVDPVLINILTVGYGLTWREYSG